MFACVHEPGLTTEHLHGWREKQRCSTVTVGNARGEFRSDSKESESASERERTRWKSGRMHREIPLRLRFSTVRRDYFPFPSRTIFFANGERHDRWQRKKCGRCGRKDARWTRSKRGCSRVDAFRECRRLRLMVFTKSPGYRAFLQHDWLLPRDLVRSLVLSSRIKLVSVGRL